MLRGWLVTAVAALGVGCYAPQLPTGAPCDPEIGNCPAGQYCVADADGGFCSYDEDGPSGDEPGPGPGGPGPGNPVADDDDDGIANADDNCPAIANAIQHNEDGDDFGDECDPCPPYADGAVVQDLDADGVADACDPFPGTPGDEIIVFEGFGGERLHQKWRMVGPWTIGNDAASTNMVGAASATLTYPSPKVGRETVRASVTLNTGGTGDTSIGVVAGHQSAMDFGVECAVGSVSSDAYLGIKHLPSTTPVEDSGFDFILGASYTLELAYAAPNADCIAFVDGNDREVNDEVSPNAPEDAGAGIRANNVDATYHWVLVVKSP